MRKLHLHIGSQRLKFQIIWPKSLQRVGDMRGGMQLVNRNFINTSFLSLLCFFNRHVGESVNERAE